MSYGNAAEFLSGEVMSFPMNFESALLCIPFDLIQKTTEQ